MDEHYFISYSRIDGADFAVRLTDDLRSGPPSHRVWLDVREMQPGQQDWDSQLVEAIKTCAAVLFVMTDDSVRDESGCKPEWVAALRYKKPVIPVRLDARSELPFRLSSRQFIDFSDSYETGVAQLRRHLAWTSTPAGLLQDLRNRRSDAGYELARARPEQRQRVEDEIAELTRRIDEQQRVVSNPETVAEQTGARIEAGMERERQPERPAVAPPRAKFVNPPPMTAPGYFQDRQRETEYIVDCLRDGGLRMMWVVGRGGVGKTAMVCRLLKALETGRLPDGPGELDVDGIVYLSSRGVQPVDFPRVFSDLCRLLPKDVADSLLERRRDPHETPAALMRALLARFPAGRWVLLLDNFEDVVDADGVGLTDSALDEGLRTLLDAPQHGVKLIVTTRVAPRDLQLVQPGVQRRLNLDEGLPTPFAEDVLRAMDAGGSLGIRDAADQLLAQARERTRGFPRALESLAAILAADRDTTLPELLAATEQMPENVVEALVGEAFNLIDALAQQVMQALAIFTGSVPAVAVDYLLQPFQAAIDSAPVLGRLVNMQLVRRDVGRYYLHQVDRDYALQRIPAGEPGDRHADPPPFSQFALRERAARYFEQTRTPRETWTSLEDLAPQRAEFELRLQAGDYDTAALILLDISWPYIQRWGHRRLARDLHERLRGHITSRWIDAACLGDLGLCYFGLGYLPRAIEVHSEALAIARDLGDLESQGTHLGNLANCHYQLADIPKAIELHEAALVIAREVGDREGEAIHLGNLGNDHGVLGRVQRSRELYGEALAIAREVGDRYGQSIHLGNLGITYAELGDTRGAIELHHEALAIDRDLGNRKGEAEDLNHLASRWAELGNLERAIELDEEALTIAREVGDRQGEVSCLAGLGAWHGELGDPRRAIELCRQALAIGREAGYRHQEVLVLITLAQACADAGAWEEATENAEQAVQIADETATAEGSMKGRTELARMRLDLGDLEAAFESARAAAAFDYPPARADTALVLGVAALRCGRSESADRAFRQAVDAADAHLASTADAHEPLYTRALALCGLALAGDPDRLSEAAAAFRSARAITCAEGKVARALRLLDALGAGDDAALLAPVRAAAAGRD
jgi:tetratricopeptide (TPR) repeat protein